MGVDIIEAGFPIASPADSEATSGRDRRRSADASRRAVVASRVDGIPDAVADGETGLLVRDYKGKDATAEVIALLDQQGFRPEIGDDEIEGPVRQQAERLRVRRRPLAHQLGRGQDAPDFVGWGVDLESVLSGDMLTQARIALAPSTRGTT